MLAKTSVAMAADDNNWMLVICVVG